MGSKPKRKPWWPWAVGILTPAVLIPVTASAWKQLGAVWAAPQEIESVKATQAALAEQTTAVYEWVKKAETKEQLQAEFEEKQVAAAPDGYRWDTATQTFVKERRK